MNTPRNQFDLFSDSHGAGASPVASLPYRLDPTCAPDDLIESINDELGLRGAERFEQTESALKRLAEAKAPSVGRMLSWAHHPDERVAIALAARQDLLGGEGRPQTEVKAALTLRAIRAFESEGLLWNPLIDQVTAADTWGTTSGAKRYALTSNAKKHGYDRVGRWYAPHQAVQKLQEFISSELDTERLRPLLKYRYPTVARSVARHAQVLDAELMRGLIHFDEETRAELYGNALLTSQQRDAMLDAAVRDLTLGTPTRRDRLKGTELIYRHLRNGGTLSRTHIHALMGALEDDRGKPEAWGGTPRAEARGILTSAALLPTLTAADLRELVKYCAGSHALERLAQAKGADASVWEAVLKANPSPLLRQSLANHKPALEAPVIVGALARSSQKAVATAALQAAGPRDFAAAFRTVVAHDPVYAVAVLEDRIDSLTNILRPDDLAPLLETEDDEFRLRVIALIRALRTPHSRARR